MVDSISQAPIATLQQLRRESDSLTQGYYAHVALNSDLQQRADIINDTTGKYSDTDKIKAYTEVYDAVRAISSQQSGANPDATTQQRAFDLTIRDSIIGKAVIDGTRKQSTFFDVRDGARSEGFNRQGFFDNLSDVQKQLPQFKIYQSGATASAGFQVTLSPEAQALLRAGAEPSDAASFLASYRQQSTQLGQQWAQAYQAAEASISLTPQLQQLADIINDRTGKYSDQAKVDAYTQATSSYDKVRNAHEESSSSDPLHLEPPAPLETDLQFKKFMATIASSTVATAVEDAGNKYFDFIKTHSGADGDTPFAQLYASLTPLERLLPGYKDFGTPLSKLIEQTAVKAKALAQQDPRQRVQEEDAALLGAEILFGAASQKVSADGRSSAGAFNTAAAQTALPDWLHITV
jgi:hypothetical protein